jgi:hypothetical protein
VSYRESESPVEPHVDQGEDTKLKSMRTESGGSAAGTKMDTAREWRHSEAGQRYCKRGGHDIF